MSFILSIATHTGIVMAADHSSSFSDGIYNLQTSISKEKLYITTNNIGISAGNQAFINNISIERYLNNFLYNFNKEIFKTPYDVSHALLNYFKAIDPNADVVFHIAGYELVDVPRPQLYEVSTKENQCTLLNKQEYVPSLVYACANNFPDIILPLFKTRLNYFSMQEAIDFTVFLINTTRKVMELSGTGCGISKDIDVLAIYPDHYTWVNKIKLHI